jgi:hypothetical protein
LSDDVGESHNLVESQPRVAATLAKKIRAWLTQEQQTWRPKYPLDANTGRPAGPPPRLRDEKSPPGPHGTGDQSDPSNEPRRGGRSSSASPACVAPPARRRACPGGSHEWWAPATISGHAAARPGGLTEP